MNFKIPMQAGKHMPIEQMKFIAIRCKKNEGFKLKFLTDFTMTYVQVTDSTDDPDYRITVFDIEDNDWDKNFTDHDVEVEPPQPDLP